MNKEDQKKLKFEIWVSSLVIFFIATIIVYIEDFNPNIIKIRGNEISKSILSDILKGVGLFLGFVITSTVMRFNQLDGMIQKLAEDLNIIINSNNYYRNTFLTQKELTSKFNQHYNTTKKSLDKAVFVNYTTICNYRADHLKWLMYPLYYSLTTLCLAFVLLFFYETIKTIEYLYSFAFCLCSLMTIWTVKINIDLVYSFFTNSFIKD